MDSTCFSYNHLNKWISSSVFNHAFFCNSCCFQYHCTGTWVCCCFFITEIGIFFLWEIQVTFPLRYLTTSKPAVRVYLPTQHHCQFPAMNIHGTSKKNCHWSDPVWRQNNQLADCDCMVHQKKKTKNLSQGACLHA